MEQTVGNFKVNDKTKIGFQNIIGEFREGGVIYWDFQQNYASYDKKLNINN